MGWKRGNYEADHAGMAAYLRGPEFDKALRSVANDVRRTAQALAPSGDEYKRSIHVERVSEGDRPSYDVVADGGHPTLVEWGRKGSRSYRGSHVMQRAAERVSRGE